MQSEEENLYILQNLEFAVVEVWRGHPEMSDHVALRAYDAVYEQYRAEARGHTPKLCTLTGLDRETYDAIQAICEWRLGRKPLADSPPDKPVSPIPVSRLLDCLRKLRKSVELHTKHAGRQGYLTFIDQFIP